MDTLIVIDYGAVELDFSSKFQFDTFYVYKENTEAVGRHTVFDTLGQCILWCDKHGFSYRITETAHELDRVIREEETARYYRKKLDSFFPHIVDAVVSTVHKGNLSEEDLDFSTLKQSLAQLNNSLHTDDPVALSENYISLFSNILIYGEKYGLLTY